MGIIKIALEGFGIAVAVGIVADVLERLFKVGRHTPDWKLKQRLKERSKDR